MELDVRMSVNFFTETKNEKSYILHKKLNPKQYHTFTKTPS